MEENVKKISQTKREIEIEVPQEKVKEELDKIIKQYSSRAKIHGFRPGMAPKDIVKRMFLPEIKKTLLDTLVPKALEAELNDHSFNPINYPVIQDLQFEEGQPIRFKAQFEIWPEIELPGYKKIKIKKREAKVTAEEVSQALEELQQNSAEYIPAEDRGVKDGDYVVTEVKGKDLETNKSLPTEKVVILAGHPDNEKDLNKNLMGLKVGEQSTFILKYDKEHQNKKLAGREIEHILKVDSIKEKNLPEINDDFAKALGEYENMKDLKKKLKEQILKSKERIVKNEMAEEIIEKISGKISLELPESLVERELMSLLKRRLEQVPNQQITKEEAEVLKSTTKKQAEGNLKNHIILNKIAEVEGFKVSEEDEDQEMKAIASSNNIPLAKVVENINQQGRKEELRNSILMKKTIDFLIEQAIIIT